LAFACAHRVAIPQPSLAWAKTKITGLELMRAKAGLLP
jgi:hypothetical protein